VLARGAADLEHGLAAERRRQVRLAVPVAQEADSAAPRVSAVTDSMIPSSSAATNGVSSTPRGPSARRKRASRERKLEDLDARPGAGCRREPKRSATGARVSPPTRILPSSAFALMRADTFTASPSTWNSRITSPLMSPVTIGPVLMPITISSDVANGSPS
jgi:hypothetical protein